MGKEPTIADIPDDTSMHTSSNHLKLALQQPLTPRQPSFRSPLLLRKSSGNAEWVTKQPAAIAGICPKDATPSMHRPKLSVNSIAATPPTSRSLDHSRSGTNSPLNWSPAYRGPRGGSESAFISHQSASPAIEPKSHRRLVDLFYMALENDSKSFDHGNNLELSHRLPSRGDLAQINTGASHPGLDLNVLEGSGARGNPRGPVNYYAQNDDSPTLQSSKLGQSGGIKPPPLPPSYLPASQTLRYSLNFDLALDNLIANAACGAHVPELEILSDALYEITSFLEVKLDEPSPSERHHVDQMVVHIEQLFNATKELEGHLELERHRFGAQYSKGITECTQRLDSLAVQLHSQRERLDAARGEILRCKTIMTHSMAQQLDTLDKVALEFKQYDSRRWRQRLQLFLVISVLFIAVAAIAAASGGTSVLGIRGRLPV